MSDTSSAASPVTVDPSRQSGPDDSSGSLAWQLGPIISDHPLKELRLYEPRWVWPPSFRQTAQYLQLRDSVKVAGVFHPLIILPDGQIIDGQHRYSCAKELGIDTVPVRIIDVPLPLTDADRLELEERVVHDTVSRRHLTKTQAAEMLYDLLRGRNEAQAKAARLANLKRGAKHNIQTSAGHLTVKELAARAGQSRRSVERAVTVMRHAPQEVRQRLRSGELTLGGAERAMKAVRVVGSDGGDQMSRTVQKRCTTPAESPTTPTTTIANGPSTPDGAQHPSVTSATPSTHQRSEVTPVVETFVHTAGTLVQKARGWERAALEQLSDALRQVELSLRDAGMRAREEHDCA